MNILGINGAIGWDGNIPMPIDEFGEMWVHGSGATLVVDGELKNSSCEERYTRIKYDGNYPKETIKSILRHNKLASEDIDLVVYIGNSCRINFALKESGYITSRIKEYFPNTKVEYLSHHLAHQSATFYTSGYESANIFSFDGAGDHELVNDRWRVPHFSFGVGNGLEIREIIKGYCNDPYTFLGAMYGYFAGIAYKSKMGITEYMSDGSSGWATKDRETYPGKIMGLASYGDYTKVDLPDAFTLDNSLSMPVLKNSEEWMNIEKEDLSKIAPEDFASWSQHQFEKHLMAYLRGIPDRIKSDNLCLGGGCALNIIANTKIIEEGIYKNVHVNTAPSDDGLHFGGALYKSAEYEEKIILPDNIAYLGVPYTDVDIEAVLC